MKVVDIKAEGDKRKEPCQFCGKPQHDYWLNCPRVSFVTIYDDGESMDVHFWPDYEGDDEPIDAA